MNMMFQMGGGMMFGGGGPPTGSDVGWDFNRYMEEHGGDWEHDPHSPTARGEFVWTGRKLRVKLEDGSWANATVLELEQYNMGPFASSTNWNIKLQYDDAAVATALGGEDAAVVHKLHRCSVEGGGVLIKKRAKLSFEWTSPPTPAARPALEEHDMPLPTLPELSDLGARKEAASARFAKVIGIMANFANSSDAEKQEVGDTLNAAMQELIALDEKIPSAFAALEDPLDSVQMRELLTTLMTWPAKILAMDGIIQVFIRGRYRSIELCLALAAVLPTRTADFERELNFSAAKARSFMLQRKNMFLHKIAEILEEDGALDKADLWYRRVCAISVDPDAGILPEHQANDLGNRAVCLRKMDKLRESLELYDRVLAIPEADRAHLAPNRQTCLREMVEWTGTNREYADVRDFRA